MTDLSNAEISVEGEFTWCDRCDVNSRDESLFTIDPEAGITLCAWGYGCNTWAERTVPERDPDEAYEDAVDAALERNTNGNTD